MLTPEPRKIGHTTTTIDPILVAAVPDLDFRDGPLQINDAIYILNTVFRSSLRNLLNKSEDIAKAKELLLAGGILLCRLPDELAGKIFYRLEDPSERILINRLVRTLSPGDPLLDVILHLAGKRIAHIMDPQIVVATGRYTTFMYDRGMQELALQSGNPQQAFEAVVPEGFLNYRDADVLVAEALSFVKRVIAAGAKADWTGTGPTPEFETFQDLVRHATDRITILLGRTHADLTRLLVEARGAPINPDTLTVMQESRKVADLDAFGALYRLGGFTSFSLLDEVLFQRTGKAVSSVEKIRLTLSSGSFFESGLTDYWREAEPALTKAQKLLRDFVTG